MFKSYYNLTKPGIIKGNLLTAVAGFFIGSTNGVNFSSLIGIILGVSLVIGSGCVLNNIIDRNIDKKMKRTKKRATATGEISPRNAYLFAGIIGLFGFIFLATLTNTITVIIGLVGIIFYVVIYGYAKRNTVFGTEIGTISGATPILAGYTAASGQIDSLGIALFVMMAIWQMPHFYAISIFRKKEYESAGIPVVSTIKGVSKTKLLIIFYIIVYAIFATVPSILGLTSISFAVIMGIAGFYWLYISIKSFSSLQPDKWARKSFGMSLIVLLIFSAVVSIDQLLP